MKAICSGLDRFLSGSPRRKPFAIIRDKVFKPANEAQDASNFRVFDLRGFSRVYFTRQFVKFCSNHSENKVTVNQSNVLVYVIRAHLPSDQHFYERFMSDMEALEGYKINKPLFWLAGMSADNVFG